ncbi:hydroxyacyl-thioester dehydratase HTD2 [Nakaseomyces bracarensis]|uniref:hydroxyacyl-thioester dehydratase HTD2 n=1 Tax=Nakaseomyces bracarensis TaxID=273131 RepID=UPI00387171D4
MSWRSLKWVQRDYLNSNTLERFNLLFGNITHQDTCKQLQLGDHLLYMNPISRSLDPDGYYSYQAPHSLVPNAHMYTKRMWTHGEIEQQRPLSLEKHYNCTETIKYVKPMGTHSCFVCIERRVTDENNTLYVTELRTLKYTNSEVSQPSVPVSIPIPTSPTTIKFTDIDILQYCQLTNNPHRIHWDYRYARDEGHQDIVVPGPLLVQTMARLSKSIGKIKYKNIAPIYPEQELVVLSSTKTNSLWLASPTGQAYATIQLLSK